MAEAATRDRILAWLETLRGATVWVLTHEAPDGDAVGSLLAAQSLLRAFGANVVALCPDPAPRIYGFLPGVDSIRHQITPGDDLPAPVAYLYVDCGDQARVGRLADQLKRGPYIVNIDHHRSNSGFGDLSWVDTASSSTGEMLTLLFLAGRVPFGPARDALYAGIVTDTGSFAFESTTARTHEVTSALVAAGASPTQLHDLIYNSREPAALALLGAGIASVQLSAGGRIAAMVLWPEDFKRTGARQEHTEGIVNYARSLLGVEIGMLLYSIEPGAVRGSIRTRPGVPADLLAAALGGGGHSRAAGFRMNADLETALATALGKAEEFLTRS